jgi:hypothetical protein
MLTLKKTKKAGKYVDTKHVDSLLSTYKKERWIHNSKRIGKEDSLSVWYSIEELKEFIATAQNNGADGIKMYFGTYSKEAAKDETHEDRQTIVLVATKNKEMENGRSFDKSIHINTENGNQILAYNLGRMCPPFCGGSGESIEWDNVGITLIDNSDGIVII